MFDTHTHKPGGEYTHGGRCQGRLRDDQAAGTLPLPPSPKKEVQPAKFPKLKFWSSKTLLKLVQDHPNQNLEKVRAAIDILLARLDGGHPNHEKVWHIKLELDAAEGKVPCPC